MSNQWLRWHIGTCEDGKFRMISRNAKVTVGNAIALWCLLLEDASHPDHRGICTRGEDFYGAILDLEFEEVAAIMAAMERLNMVSIGHGNITICNWNKRQFETDAKDPTNAERQRRFKEKKKQSGDKTDGNGKVTAEKHQKQNTDTDTDKRASNKRVREKVTLEELSIDHIRDWLAEKRAGNRYLHHDEVFILEYFKNYCQSKNKRYDDYVAALRNSFEWEACQPQAKGAINGKPSKLDLIAQGIADARAKREQAASGPVG